MRTAFLCLLALCLATPALADVTGETLLCYTFSKRDVKTILGQKRQTGYACVSTFGEVVGATMNRGGFQVCTITGAVDFSAPNCADVVVCSRAVRVCL